uniref:Uncharacterized protein n=1 Tax=Chromera velia CCMP2878 TaxID=1169474 RepID=A0A0G4HMA3_9ALVE|eukprot:Cvel_29070.t1-p1 / transcript=Cvel_29070.t1 / gene=Cvel_29070 / organism=Chromera_velia_CCMP2878 / gene_product=hypothetical protein / transcript_product=hypothetical protein / location=Cvel_scaffold3921:1485-5369(-) / protein_length=1038 / sequence_SO=supercontig / SO=protein_coding / is_pseudo=false
MRMAECRGVRSLLIEPEVCSLVTAFEPLFLLLFLAYASTDGGASTENKKATGGKKGKGGAGGRLSVVEASGRESTGGADAARRKSSLLAPGWAPGQQQQGNSLASRRKSAAPKPVDTKSEAGVSVRDPQPPSASVCFFLQPPPYLVHLLAGVSQEREEGGEEGREFASTVGKYLPVPSNPREAQSDLSTAFALGADIPEIQRRRALAAAAAAEDASASRESSPAASLEKGLEEIPPEGPKEDTQPPRQTPPPVPKLHQPLHMTWNSFLRFCQDFNLVPGLSSIEAASFIFESAECLDTYTKVPCNLPTSPKQEDSPFFFGATGALPFSASAVSMSRSPTARPPSSPTAARPPSASSVASGRSVRSVASRTSRGAASTRTGGTASPRRVREKPEPEPVSKEVHVFGLAAFCECVLRVFFRFLLFRGTETQAASPTAAKFLWALTFISSRVAALKEVQKSPNNQQKASATGTAEKEKGTKKKPPGGNGGQDPLLPPALTLEVPLDPSEKENRKGGRRSSKSKNTKSEDPEINQFLSSFPVDTDLIAPPTPAAAAAAQASSLALPTDLSTASLGVLFAPSLSLVGDRLPQQFLSSLHTQSLTVLPSTHSLASPLSPLIQHTTRPGRNRLQEYMPREVFPRLPPEKPRVYKWLMLPPALPPLEGPPIVQTGAESGLPGTSPANGKKKETLRGGGSESPRREGKRQGETVKFSHPATEPPKTSFAPSGAEPNGVSVSKLWNPDAPSTIALPPHTVSRLNAVSLALPPTPPHLIASKTDSRPSAPPSERDKSLQAKMLSLDKSSKEGSLRNPIEAALSDTERGLGPEKSLEGGSLEGPERQIYETPLDWLLRHVSPSTFAPAPVRLARLGLLAPSESATTSSSFSADEKEEPSQQRCAANSAKKKVIGGITNMQKVPQVKVETGDTLERRRLALLQICRGRRSCAIEEEIDYQLERSRRKPEDIPGRLRLRASARLLSDLRAQVPEDASMEALGKIIQSLMEAPCVCEPVIVDVMAAASSVRLHMFAPILALNALGDVPPQEGG